jgi:hypothetical protein
VRSSFTWIVVAAIGLLAALAVGDALRPDAKSTSAAPSAPETTTQARPATLRDTLLHEGVAGQMIYSDQDCILHSLVLPTLEDDVVRGDNGAGAIHMCRFEFGAGRLLGAEAAISRDGSRAALCRNGRVSLLDNSGKLIRWPYRGCRVALRPDGAVTQVRDGEIVQGRQVLYSRAALHEAARANPSLPTALAGRRYHVHVKGFAWMDERRLIAGLDIAPTDRPAVFLAALFDGQALTGIDLIPVGPLDDWVVSRTGLYAATVNGTIIARDGHATDPPAGLPEGQAAAFSPDERWLAYVNGTSIFLVSTPLSGELGRIIRLPTPARDLVWEPGGPVVDTSRLPG